VVGSQCQEISQPVCDGPRQYLGCPASSATVERLFSQVGIAFADQRKNSKAEILSDILFTKLNVN
jgi:hypothetical protein